METKVFMGVFDDDKKKWLPGAAVEGAWGLTSLRMQAGRCGCE